jgi:hypothetical protein
MLTREALLSSLPETKYGEVKFFRLSNEIWNGLQITFEGDKHSKKDKIWSWIFLFQDVKMFEDETLGG